MMLCRGVSDPLKRSQEKTITAATNNNDTFMNKNGVVAGNWSKDEIRKYRWNKSTHYTKWKGLRYQIEQNIDVLVVGQ